VRTSFGCFFLRLPLLQKLLLLLLMMRITIITMMQYLQRQNSVSKTGGSDKESGSKAPKRDLGVELRAGDLHGDQVPQKLEDCN